MSELFMKMAQAAAEDKTLFASYIQQYASKRSISWEQVARELQMGTEQLAKLALCGRFQPTLNRDGIMQVADYVGVEPAVLNAFVAEAVAENETLPQASHQDRPLPIQKSGSLTPISKARKYNQNRGVVAILSKKLSWVAVAVFLLLFLLGAFVSAQPQDTAAATLVVNEGQATIVQANARNAGPRMVVAGGEALAVSAGDHIYLTAGSTALIHLSDGSTVELGAGTELNIDELVIDDTTFRVHLRLLAGRTLSRVVSVLSLGDRFDISTPSSTASVRGTVFTVAYISADETYISCDEGQVEVALSGQEPQMVTAGMEVTAVVGQPLQVKSQQAPEPEIEVEEPAPIPPAVPEPVVEIEPPAESETISLPVEELPILNGPDGIGPPQPIWNSVPDEPPSVSEPPASDDENNENESSPPPDSLPIDPPAPPPDDGGDAPPGDDDGNGNGNDNNNGGNGRPPDEVPGDPPIDPPGEGDPPDGGGGPPGQDKDK